MVKIISLILPFRAALCSLLILGAISASTHAQDQRLRDLAKFYARDHPGQPMLMVGPTADHEAKTISELTKEAELVIQARVGKLQSYFGRAGDRVVTDYAIQDWRLLAGPSDHLTVVDGGGEYLMFLVPSLAGGGRHLPYNGGIFKIDVGVIRPVIQGGRDIFEDAFDSPLPLVIGQIETAAIARPKR